MTIRNGLERATSPEVNSQQRQLMLRDLAREALVVDEQLRRSGQDEFTIGRVFDTIEAGLASDPEGLLSTLREVFDPSLRELGLLEGEERQGGETMTVLDKDNNFVSSVIQLDDGSLITQNDRKPYMLEDGQRVVSSSVNASNVNDLGRSATSKVTEQQAAVETFNDSSIRLLEILSENPNANTFAAAAARFGTNVAQEVAALRDQLSGKQWDIEDGVLDPSNYEESFSGLAQSSAQTKSLFVGLAFQAAAASNQEGRSVSNRDIERFLGQIGANNADPGLVAASIKETARQVNGGFLNNYKAANGQDFDGDLGFQQLMDFGQTPTPKGENLQQLSDDEFLRSLSQ
jgi:hypothetical protein